MCAGGGGRTREPRPASRPPPSPAAGAGGVRGARTDAGPAGAGRGLARGLCSGGAAGPRAPPRPRLPSWGRWGWGLPGRRRTGGVLPAGSLGAWDLVPSRLPVLERSPCGEEERLRGRRDGGEPSPPRSAGRGCGVCARGRVPGRAAGSVLGSRLPDAVW